MEFLRWDSQEAVNQRQPRNFISASDNLSFVPATEGIPTAPAIRLLENSLNMQWICSYELIPKTKWCDLFQVHLHFHSYIFSTLLYPPTIPPTPESSPAHALKAFTCTHAQKKKSESFYAEKVDNLQIGKNLPHLCFFLMRKRHQEATK